jgi:serine acetyltransferase/GT2 family glycosyltransferase
MSSNVRVVGRNSSSLAISVVIATYQRNESVLELLGQLAGQTLPRDTFEVIVVDDGSAIPAAPVLEAASLPIRLTVLTQQNAGPAAARHRAILSAVGSLIVIIDDDMRVMPDFLASHLAAHDGKGHHVVLGRLRAQPGASLELFDRLHLDLLDKLARDFAADASALRGSSLYTGNVSFRREEYLHIGGFDPAFRISEDAELGIRLQESGASFALSDEAQSFHASDHTSVKKWMTRSVAYGRTDAAVSDKHPGIPSANPWRFLYLVNPVSRPLLLASALAPWLTAPIAWLAMWASQAFAAAGFERVALAGTTFTFGIQYFRGLGTVPEPDTGPTRLQRYLNTDEDARLGFFGKFARCWADIKADHQAARSADARYATTERKGSLIGDAIQRIGFQMMIAYRVMRLFRALRLGILAKLTSRAIRHLYSADIHWDAQLAPGVLIVHGVGLVVSHAAKVGPGCILFQHVTLGESIHPTRREIGGPTLEADVHVGPGATLLGPIVLGRGTKVTAGALVMQDVPPNSVVETASSVIRSRRVAVSGEETLSAGLRAISQD